MRAEDVLEEDPVALMTLGWVRDRLASVGQVDERVTRTQVAFRRGRGFAWLWSPLRHLGRRGAPVVLSVALGRHDDSPRWKQVVQPSPRHWMHHLEVRAAADLDEEVAAWLAEAADRA